MIRSSARSSALGWVGVAVLLASACGSAGGRNSGDGGVGGAGGAAGDRDGGGGGSGGAPADAGADAGGAGGTAPAACDVTHPFGTPVLVDGINAASGNLTGARLSPDELTVYFNVDPGSNRDIYTASRPARTAAFGSMVALSAINTSGSEGWPSVTADGLNLYFETARPTPNQVYVATRTTLVAQFSGAAPVVNVSPGAESGQPFVLPDGSALYLFIGVPADLYRAQLGTNGQFETPVAVSTVNTPSVEYFPTPTPDELTIYFASDRADPPAQGNFDIWMARRASRTDTFGPPVNVQELNTAAEEFPSWISPDNCRLYFSRNGASGERIFVAERSM